MLMRSTSIFDTSSTSRRITLIIEMTEKEIHIKLLTSSVKE